MTRQTRYSPEVRSRAVRMVLQHRGEHVSEWVTIGSIASKIVCTAETLRGRVRQAERDQGQRAEPMTEERERIKALEREVRELRQANDILRKASAYVAMAEPRSGWSGAGRSHDRVRPSASRRPRVEPICRLLAIASSTYHEHVARRRDPAKLPAHAKRDAELTGHSKREAIRGRKRYIAREVFTLLRKRLREINQTQFAA